MARSNPDPSGLKRLPSGRHLSKKGFGVADVEVPGHWWESGVCRCGSTRPSSGLSPRARHGDWVTTDPSRGPGPTSQRRSHSRSGSSCTWAPFTRSAECPATGRRRSPAVPGLGRVPSMASRRLPILGAGRESAQDAVRSRTRQPSESESLPGLDSSPRAHCSYGLAGSPELGRGSCRSLLCHDGYHAGCSDILVR